MIVEHVHALSLHVLQIKLRLLVGIYEMWRILHWNVLRFGLLCDSELLLGGNLELLLLSLVVLGAFRELWAHLHDHLGCQLGRSLPSSHSVVRWGLHCVINPVSFESARRGRDLCDLRSLFQMLLVLHVELRCTGLEHGIRVDTDCIVLAVQIWVEELWSRSLICWAFLCRIMCIGTLMGQTPRISREPCLYSLPC